LVRINRDWFALRSLEREQQSSELETAREWTQRSTKSGKDLSWRSKRVGNLGVRHPVAQDHPWIKRLEVKIFQVQSSFNLWIGRIEKLKSSINLESINVIGDDSPANVSTTLKNDNVDTCVA